MSSPKSPDKSPQSPRSPPEAVEAETPAQQARDGFIQPVSHNLLCNFCLPADVLFQDTDSDSAYSLS